MDSRSSKSQFDISIAKEFKLQELAALSLTPIVRSIHHWWLQRAERHYLICADVEQQRAREAQMNVAYYQKRAALARSARN
jgi:heme exporter protein D